MLKNHDCRQVKNSDYQREHKEGGEGGGIVELREIFISGWETVEQMFVCWRQ